MKGMQSAQITFAHRSTGTPTADAKGGFLLVTHVRRCQSELLLNKLAD